LTVRQRNRIITTEGSTKFLSRGEERGAGSFYKLSKGGGVMEAYCVKCKGKKEMKDAKKVEMKNGRKAMKGQCPDCGTTMFRIQKG